MPPAMKEVFFGQNIKGTEESDIVLSLKREKKIKEQNKPCSFQL